ncbi:hypothetical protein LX16_3142 [Stackebrandtia albiflava]|uniref:Uncharacterized protein n=1 Tax=Stackebrandtia albiflava TaxID=406432 RepID=A0A562V3F3_9ACTN|nr:hypothetical protein [Stackebrandtia albiflava]TWJ12385.1 hypothetical protein LX16_3142 [Stackebrandtia albiflava]
MPRRIAALAALTTALTGCTGTAVFFDPTAEIKAAAAEALADLAALPALRVQGTVPSIGGDGLQEAVIDATVVNGGSAWTELTTGRGEAHLLSVPDSLHVAADAGFWEDEYFQPGMTGELDGRWVRLDPVEWIDPGPLFDPSHLAATIGEAFEIDDTLEMVTPATVDEDGVPAFPIPYGDGHLYVSAEAPHRFLGVDTLVSLSAPDNTIRRTVDVVVKPAARDHVAGIAEAANAAVPEMAEPFSLAGEAVVEWAGSELDCVPGIVCEMSGSVEVEVTDDSFTERLLLVQTATVKADGLGEETCVGTATAELVDTVELSCETRFSGAEGRFEGEHVVEWVGVYTFDTEAAAEVLSTQFAAATA